MLFLAVLFLAVFFFAVFLPVDLLVDFLFADLLVDFFRRRGVCCFPIAVRFLRARRCSSWLLAVDRLQQLVGLKAHKDLFVHRHRRHRANGQRMGHQHDRHHGNALRLDRLQRRRSV